MSSHKKERLVVALGGNAILKQGQKGTLEQQISNLETTAETIVNLSNQGYQLAITHGNGPQVGNILLQNEQARAKVSSLPLDACGSESQGLIGYIIQEAISRAVAKEEDETPSVASLVTRTLVDSSDPAFSQPTKPIGPFYSQAAAEKLRQKRNYTMVEDADRGYRRVVASPEPQEIVESRPIRQLLSEGIITIAAGGGGIPVVKRKTGLRGVEAVIDKDLTAEKLAEAVGAKQLTILTDVNQVMLNYGQPNKRPIERMTPQQAKKFEQEGHFARGSMQPKIKACREFVKATGENAVIGSINQFKQVVREESGTIISSKAS